MLSTTPYRDAAYMNASKRYKLEENDKSFFIVCGLNHVKTEKATYINFAVGNVISVNDSKFRESARMYICTKYAKCQHVL